MSIYEFEKREILENCTSMVKADVDKWSNSENCTIYSIDDYIENLKGCGLLEDELNGRTEEELRKDL